MSTPAKNLASIILQGIAVIAFALFSWSFTKYTDKVDRTFESAIRTEERLMLFQKNQETENISVKSHLEELRNQINNKK